MFCKGLHPLGRHPGRAATAARPRTQVPRRPKRAEAGIHGSRPSRRAAPGRD